MKSWFLKIFQWHDPTSLAALSGMALNFVTHRIELEVGIPRSFRRESLSSFFWVLGYPATHEQFVALLCYETWTKYFTIWNAQERISHRAFNHSAYYSHFVRYSKERTLQSYGIEKRYFDIFLSQGIAIAMKTHMLFRQAHIKVVKMRSRNTLDNIRSKDLQMWVFEC